jgi:thioredoxin reductase (NADPH)
VDKEVAVVGGGNSAVEEAIYLAKRCKKVYLIHRRDQLRAVAALQQIAFNTPNIEMVWNSIPLEIVGEKRGFVKIVTGIKVENIVDLKEHTIPIDGVFISIGTTPVSEIFEGQLNMDENGYIITQQGSPFTNVPGVFAAGDVQNPLYRQAITAAASGCIAAIEADKFLMLENSK